VHFVRLRGLRGFVLQIKVPGRLPGRPAAVVVTAGVSEVRPRSFTIAVRLRPLRGDREAPLNSACEIELEDPAGGRALPIGDQLRDTLIALEHSAQHHN
jgi:hypothetical protein